MDRTGCLPNGYAVLDGRVLHDDQWDGYPAERDRLAGWIASGRAAGGRTVLLSGDVHSSWAFAGPVRPRPAQPVAVEITTPAVSSAAMGRAHYPGLWRVPRPGGQPARPRRAGPTSPSGATRSSTLTPDAVHGEWWFVHPYDEDPPPTPSWRRRSSRAGRLAARLGRRDDPSPDPDRPGLPDPLPDRPDDLPRLRRRRRARLTAEGAGIAVTAAGFVAAGLAGLAAVTKRRR